MTLTEFLLARIAEDEEGARGELEMSARSALGVQWLDLMRRVLAECEAKRRIVGLHPHRVDRDDAILGCDSCPVGILAPYRDYCLTLRALALPYADHPDYREEWRP